MVTKSGAGEYKVNLSANDGSNSVKTEISTLRVESLNVSTEPKDRCAHNVPLLTNNAITIERLRDMGFLGVFGY